MNDGDALLRAIAEAPDDDAPRLIYADWLEEHGHAERAEFIRVQCELARPEGSRTHRAELHLRARKLWQDHRVEWSLEVSSVAAVTYRRGFGETIVCDATGILQDPIAPNMIGIVRDVQLIGTSFPELLAAIPELDRVCVVRMTSVGLDDEWLRQFTQTDVPSSVSTVDLRWNNLTEDSLVTLQDRRFSRFKSIFLGGNHFRSDAREELVHILGTRVSFDVERPPDHLYILKPTDHRLTGLDADGRQVVLMYVGRFPIRLIAYCFDLDGQFLAVEEYATGGRAPISNSRSVDDPFVSAFAARLGLANVPIAVRRFYHSETGVGIQDFTATARRLIEDPPDLREQPGFATLTRHGGLYSHLKYESIPRDEFEFGELMD